MKEAILIINAGSSSIKFSLFTEGLDLLYRGKIENIHLQPKFTGQDKDSKIITCENLENSAGYESSLQYLLNWIDARDEKLKIKAAGHRVVHGGVEFTKPIIVDDEVIVKLTALVPLAPLHQPYNLEGVNTLAKIYPGLPQIACFDTSFHRSNHRLSQIFAIPRELTEQGVIRYGFHGLSYEYIAKELPKYLGSRADGKIIVAHLGNGSSMCALRGGESKASTMGFTALDGLMMGTRCGNIDPGVLLYLMQEKKMNAEQIAKLLYNQSGLLGVSGLSSDMAVLSGSDDEAAKEAVDLFCYRAAGQLASLATSIEGCDAIIFTAGIGENSPIIRQKICHHLKWLGVSINQDYNYNNQHLLSREDSKILVLIIPTNEELMIVKHSIELLKAGKC